MAAAKFLLPALVAALAFAIYAPALTYGAVIDDDQLLGTDLSVRAIFLEPVQLQTPYYRPLTNASYAVLHAFDAGAPREAAAHFSNLIFYTAGILLLFALCLRLLEGGRFAWPASFVACLLFAVHPIHTESVAWIGARPDIIVGALIAATLLAYSAYRRSHSTWWLAAVWLFAIATVMAKEVGWTIAILLPLCQWLYTPETKPPAPAQPPRAQRRRRTQQRTLDEISWLRDERIRTALILGSIFLIYITLRIAAFDGLGGEGLSYRDLRPDRLLGAIGFYVEKAFVPRDFIAFYGEVPADAHNIVIGAVALLAWCAALALSIVRRVRAVTLGLVWAAVTLAPSLPVFVTYASNAPIAERYLYLPTMGVAICFAWLAAVAIDRIAAMRERATQPMRAAPLAALAGVAVFAIAGLWAYQTVDRIHVYEDLESFWETTVRDNPAAGFPHAGLAGVYEDAGRIDEAEEQYRVAIAGVMTDEQRALAWSNLGALLSQNGDYDGAVEAHSQAVAIRPRSAQLHYNFAVAHRRQATATTPPDPAILGLALDEARSAVELDADDPLHLALLATVAFESGDFETARETYRQVLRIEHTGRWADLARRELSRPELQ